MSVVMKKMLIVLLMVFFLVAGSAGYGVWTYKDEIPFPEMKHIKNIWIPGYIFSLYPLFLNTLELYNLI